MRPEAKLVKDIMVYLKGVAARGEPIWFVKIHGGPHQQAGLPDLHITYRGRSLWLEVKPVGGAATPLQESTIRRVAAAGGVSAVVRSVIEVQRILSAVAEEVGRCKTS